MNLIRRMIRSRTGPSALAVLLALAAVTLVIVAGGYDLGRAATALWNGSFGSSYSIFNGTLMRATPLILVGLAVAVAFRAGVLNIGAEGQLIAGACAAVAVGLSAGTWPGFVAIPSELFAGVCAGALWAAIAATLKRRFGVLEVISTLMLNFVALFSLSYFVRGPLQEPTHIYPQTLPIAPSARLPLLVTGQQLHAGFLLAVALCVAGWWMLRSTAAGFRIRVVGAGPAAAASAGLVDVPRVVFATFLLSGAVAGLGGAVQATGATYGLFEGFSPGYGYTAIAVALLARLNPLGVIASGIFFGALEAGGAGMQRDAGVPAGFVAAIEALAILAVLAVDRAHAVLSDDSGAAGPEPAT